MNTSKKLAVIEALIDAKKKPIADNSKEVKQMAQQAISSMRDSVNNNQAIMDEIVNRLGIRPKEFIIQRDGKGDMIKIIPVYD